VIEDPHLHARGALDRVEHPSFGPIIVPRSPLRFAGLPPEPHVPTGGLGADGRAVLVERLALDAATLDALEAEGVI
jgi:CoA:oxalate CoA-transferase